MQLSAYQATLRELNRQGGTAKLCGEAKADGNVSP
jgi:hypothetical protein